MGKKGKGKHIPVQVPPLELFAVPRESIAADPLGSYTGRPVDADALPVQDADDL